MSLAFSANSRKTGSAVIVRAEGQIPAVVYGPEIKPVSVSFGYTDFVKLYKAAGESTLIDLAIDGGKPVKVIIQDVQNDPVSGKITHADFRQINMSKEMAATIEIRFIGESLAVKGLGGTLMKSLVSLNVKCLPKDLVGNIEVDISVLKTFEDTIRIKDLNLPAGIKVSDNPETAVAKVKAPLTEEQLKAMEDSTSSTVDLTKLEVSEKKGKEEEDGAEGAAAADGAKKEEKKEEKKK